MKKLYLILFIFPLFINAQDLPIINTESWEEKKYIERGEIFEESYQEFLENEMNMQAYFLDQNYGESWGEECDKILDYYNRYGTITERMWIDISCVCSPFCYSGNYLIAQNASSTLSSNGNYNYDVNNMTDGDPRTAWVEGKSGYGIGESFECIFEADNGNITILNGLQKSVKLWKYNSRVKTFKVYYDNMPICYLQLEDNMLWQHFDFDEVFLDPNDTESKYGEYRECCTGVFRFEIVDIYPGEKWKDVCISEFEHNHQH